MKEGRGYIFAGPSGSGKTTVSRLSSQRYLVINDEMVLLSRINGDYWISGSPLKASYASIDVKAPVKTIFLLQPSNYNSLKRLKAVETVLKLAPLLAYLYDRSLGRLENLSKKIAVSSVLLEEMACYEMYFEKSERFWKHIEAMESN